MKNIILYLICTFLIIVQLSYAQDKGGQIIIHELRSPESLNPVISNEAAAENINKYIYESLLTIDEKTLELKPQIAAGLPEISKDYLSYTFELNKDAAFSDGHPLTGEDVIFTMKMIKNIFVNSQVLKNYYSDVNSAEFVEGNKYKIKFTMSRVYFKNIYSLGDFKILPKHIFDKDNISNKISWEDLKIEEEEELPNKALVAMKKLANLMNSKEASMATLLLIGSGPYIFEKWNMNTQTISLKRNENYWRTANSGFLDNIIYRVNEDLQSSLVEMKNGRLDFMFVIQPADFFELNAEQYNLKKALVTEPVYTYIAWNNESKFFADKKVRWAMSYATDRDKVNSEVLYNNGVPVESHIFYKSKFCNTNLPVIQYNLEKARSLLTESGWTDTDGDGILDKVIDGKKTDFKFTFMNNNNPKRKKVMNVVIESLKQLGIVANLQEYEWSVFLNKVSNHNFEACYASWQISVTPDDPFQIWHSSQAYGGSNLILYNNPESDKLLEENRITLDDVKRKEILDKWQQIIYDDQAVTFLFSEKGRYLYSERFLNANFYEIPGSVNFTEWWIPKNLQK